MRRFEPCSQCDVEIDCCGVSILRAPASQGNTLQVLALLIVTRYDNYMEKATSKRGRPRKTNPSTAAERMRAYRKRKRDAGFKNVRTWVSGDDDGKRGYSDHRILDARSLALHCKIAQKIEGRRDLLNVARRNLARWRQKSAGEKPKYLQEWEKILDKPWPKIAELITNMSDESTRLRSSSPFAGVLDIKERNRIYAAFRA